MMFVLLTEGLCSLKCLGMLTFVRRFEVDCELTPWLLEVGRNWERYIC